MSLFEHPSGRVTHRGIVNTPECDENRHMNVQFYWARFSEADRHFAFAEGLENAGLKRLSRHVRYHAELHGAFGLFVTSRFARDASGDIVLLHQMFDAEEGKLSATAVDRLALQPDLEAVLEARSDMASLPPAALPRSITRPVPDFGMSDAEWIASGAVMTCRTSVPGHLVGLDGAMTDRGLVALSVEAAPASWAHIGFGQGVLDTLGLGRVALEKRITVARRPLEGDLVHVLTRIMGVERSTFTVCHRYVDSRTSECFGVCDVTLIAMDLAARKSVPLPDDVRSRLSDLAMR